MYLQWYLELLRLYCRFDSYRERSFLAVMREKSLPLFCCFSLHTSPDALCFFGYSYIMYRIEYYPCGGADPRCVPVRAFMGDPGKRGKAVRPALSGAAPRVRQDKHLTDTRLYLKHPQKGSERYGLRRGFVPPISERRRRRA